MKFEEKLLNGETKADFYEEKLLTVIQPNPWW